MTVAYVGIGSNLEPAVHVRAAVAALRAEFAVVACSPVYRTEPVGFQGPPFLNLVARFSTELSLGEVLERLHAVEGRYGRDRLSAGGSSKGSYTSRTLDLDLLLFGERVAQEPVVLPRRDVLEYPFVAKPLAELDPDTVLPGDGRTFREVWAAFPAGAEAGMVRVDPGLPG